MEGEVEILRGLPAPTLLPVETPNLPPSPHRRNRKRMQKRLTLRVRTRDIQRREWERERHFIWLPLISFERPEMTAVVVGELCLMYCAGFAHARMRCEVVDLGRGRGEGGGTYTRLDPPIQRPNSNKQSPSKYTPSHTPPHRAVLSLCP